MATNNCTNYDNRIIMEQGDSKNFYCGLFSADVSDWSLWDGYFQAKRNLDDTTLVIDVSVACTDSSMWIFPVTSNDTSTAGVFDYQFFINKGSEYKTVIHDKLVINDSVRV